MSEENYFSKKYVDGIYIPAGLLVFGTFIMKRDWVPYAIALAAALGAWKFMTERKFIGGWANRKLDTNRIALQDPREC